jgi:hypothetical protein
MKVVVALEIQIDNGWYGENHRYFYSGPNENGFKNKTEASKYKSKLKRYVKDQIYRNRYKLKWMSDTSLGVLEEFPTYGYCCSGPSYSCTNIEVKDLETYIPMTKSEK